MLSIVTPVSERESEDLTGKVRPRGDRCQPLGLPVSSVGRFERTGDRPARSQSYSPDLSVWHTAFLTTYLGSNAILTTVYRHTEGLGWCRHPRQLPLRHAFLRARIGSLLSGGTLQARTLRACSIGFYPFAAAMTRYGYLVPAGGLGRLSR